MRIRHFAVPVALVALAILSGCSTPTSAPAEAPAASSASSEPNASGCSYPEASGGVREVKAPPAEPTVSGTVNVTLATSAGDLKIAMNADKTPCTVGSFVSLSEQKYYDNTTCHRLTTAGIFVLQCGDPSGTGMGGPGYSYPDELDGSETYPAGTVAMANAGANTNGSQFFLVYEDSSLPPSYTVFGTLDEASLALVKGIAAKGVDPSSPNAAQGDGAPAEAVTIKTVSVG